jgi:hypothetical protein
MAPALSPGTARQGRCVAKQQLAHPFEHSRILEQAGAYKKALDILQSLSLIKITLYTNTA